MTDAEIEAAARELCRVRGLDPDEAKRVPVFHGDGKMSGRTVTLLGLVTEEVVAFAQVGTAIASVMVKPKRAKKEKA
jgi:hypothetical protein